MSRKSPPMKTPVRQRKPAFDREWGVDVAEALFHTRGYDAVGVAELTQAMDIVPPSLYAAYGSKLALFERALTQYTTRHALPLDEVLAAKGTPPEVLTQLFVTAAQHYTQDPVRRGCMVTEAMRADDSEAAGIATALAAKGSNAIRGYIEQFVSGADAERIADYVLLTLRGISSYACLGYSQAKLVECAKVAGRAMTAEFKGSRRPK